MERARCTECVKNSNARGRENIQEEEARPWTSKTKAQERPKKKIKREAKRGTGWKKGGLEKITTLNRKLNKKEGMKKYSKSKKVDSCARWRERSAGRESSRGKIIPWTLEIIMTGDDSVNLSIRRVCIRLSEKNKYRLLGQNIVQLKKKENESTVRLFAVSYWDCESKWPTREENRN